MKISDHQQRAISIWLKDKNKKPQAKHLQARADFLLKYLARYAKVKELKAKKNQSKKHAGGTSKKSAAASALTSASPTTESSKVKSSRKETGKEHHHEKKKKKREASKENEELTEERRKESKPPKKEKPNVKLDYLTVNKSKYHKDIQNKSSQQFQEVIFMITLLSNVSNESVVQFISI
ncbi:unnamed protein product [Anisakis simplex]|uniref:60S ribosomal protein L4 n=1 Tax=Anisakis simplex TaxID=6269 RepID=A0A0M3JBD8_ANISI|nr:unnamed protein product [Anisakis simplex]